MFALISRYKNLKDEKFEEIISDHNLRKIDVWILFYLDSCGEKDTARDIAAAERFTKGHISQSTKRLLEMDYITSRKDENDLRVSHLALTQKARPIIDAMNFIRNDTFGHAFEGVTNEELAIVKKVCLRVCDNIEKDLKG